MTTTLQTRSAKIYQFPVKRVASASAQPKALLAAANASKAVNIDAWYHQEAIVEAENAVRS